MDPAGAGTFNTYTLIPGRKFTGKSKSIYPQHGASLFLPPMRRRWPAPSG